MIDLSPACQRMIDVLTGITDDQLGGATPCDDFTVADRITIMGCPRPVSMA
ncbi:hypothetical protein [Amycolatopsis sp.]|uniref:hypothetical protein n=1 Tax=Amycolatopsis sp. TaxID=37632 RepID=UPI0026215BAC|nr:hypothetical protein [Amycolatopsis sp.]